MARAKDVRSIYRQRGVLSISLNHVGLPDWDHSFLSLRSHPFLSLRPRDTLGRLFAFCRHGMAPHGRLPCGNADSKQSPPDLGTQVSLACQHFLPSVSSDAPPPAWLLASPARSVAIQTHSELMLDVWNSPRKCDPTIDRFPLNKTNRPRPSKRVLHNSSLSNGRFSTSVVITRGGQPTIVSAIHGSASALFSDVAIHH